MFALSIMVLLQFCFGYTHLFSSVEGKIEPKAEKKVEPTLSIPSYTIELSTEGVAFPVEHQEAPITPSALTMKLIIEAINTYGGISSEDGGESKSKQIITFYYDMKNNGNSSVRIKKTKPKMKDIDKFKENSNYPYKVQNEIKNWAEKFIFCHQEKASGIQFKTGSTLSFLLNSQHPIFFKDDTLFTEFISFCMYIVRTRFYCLDYDKIKNNDEGARKALEDLLITEQEGTGSDRKARIGGFCMEITSNGINKHRLVYTKEHFGQIITVSEEQDMENDTTRCITKTLSINNLDRKKFREQVNADAHRVFGEKTKVEMPVKIIKQEELPKYEQISQKQSIMQLVRKKLYQKRYTIGGVIGMGILGTLYFTKRYGYGSMIGQSN